MNAPSRLRRGALFAIAAVGAAATCASADPTVRYVQGSQGLVAERVGATAATSVPAHRPVDSTMVQGAMTQVLREPQVGISAVLASPAPAVAFSETVLPNGARLRTMPTPTAVSPAAPVPALTIADTAGEVMPRPLVLYRKPARGAVTH